MVVPISPNRMSENVAWCGPPASDVERWQGPALTVFVQKFTPSSQLMPVCVLPEAGRPELSYISASYQALIASTIPPSMFFDICLSGCNAGSHRS